MKFKLFTQHRKTKYFDITRDWWFESRSMKSLGNFADAIQETIHQLGYPKPDKLIELNIGTEEGRRVLKGGYVIEIPNCFSNLLCWYIFRAALRRVNAPLLENRGAIQAKFEYEVQRRLSAGQTWLWFKTHRIDRINIDLRYG